MTKRTTLIASIIGLLILSAVPFAFAQGRRHRARHDGEALPMMFGRLERARRALDLSDAQADELKGIAATLREQNAPYRDQLRGEMKDVAQILLKDPNDVAGAQALLDSQAAARKTIQANMLNAASKALKVLTPEQRGKVSSFIEERAGRGLSR